MLEQSGIENMTIMRRWCEKQKDDQNLYQMDSRKTFNEKMANIRYKSKTYRPVRNTEEISYSQQSKILPKKKEEYRYAKAQYIAFAKRFTDLPEKYLDKEKVFFQLIEKKSRASSFDEEQKMLLAKDLLLVEFLSKKKNIRKRARKLLSKFSNKIYVALERDKIKKLYSE